MRLASVDGVRRRAYTPAVPLSARYGEPPIAQMLDSNLGKRMDRLEEGLNTPEALRALAQQPWWERLRARARLSRKARRRALLTVVSLALLVTTFWRWSVWERNLVARVVDTKAVCMSGAVMGTRVRVLGFADPSLPVMYFPRWNVSDSTTSRVRSVEQSDMCPEQASRMRYERVNVTYFRRLRARQTVELVHGLPAACVQHFTDAWNKTC